MTQALAALDAIWKVLAVGLVVGAGLPALFSLGVRHRSEGRRPIAWASFAVVGAAVAVGIAGIVAHGLGMKLF